MQTPGQQPSSGMCSHSSLISTPLICPNHASPVPGYHKEESRKQLKYTVSWFWGCQPVLDPSNCRVKRKSLHFLLASTNQPCSLILRLNHSHFSYLHMTLTMSVSLSVLFLFKKKLFKILFLCVWLFFPVRSIHRGPKENTRCFGTRVSDGWESPCECWELTLSPLEGEPRLLPTKSSV